MSARIVSRFPASIPRAPHPVCAPLLRPYFLNGSRNLQPITHRFVHAIPRPPTLPQDLSSSTSNNTKTRKELEPHYRLNFTCVPCNTPSSHIVSKQGYHKGSVLISCPKCRNRHVISDHLNIFGDRKITVEDLLREKGQLVRRGTLGETGDIEFWQDTPPDSAGANNAADLTGVERSRETGISPPKTIDSTPSASVLSGDTGARPSVQNNVGSSPTPSTRRQYHKENSFIPPSRLQKQHIAPLGRAQAESSENMSSSSHTSKSPRCPTDIVDRKGDFMTLSESDRIFKTFKAREKIAPQGPEQGENDDRLARAHQIAPERKPGEARRVYCSPLFRQVRLIPLETDSRISVQLTPGVALFRRPPGGTLPEDEDSPPPEREPRELPLDARPIAAKRRGFFRPTFVPIVPASSIDNLDQE